VRILIHPRTITADDKELRTRVAEALETALGRLGRCLRRVDVYLTDVNGPRGGPDKRCRIVARLTAGSPVVVSRTDRDPAAAAAAIRCRRSVRSYLKMRQGRRARSGAR
jgi:putative sigma-54 modulation protein